MTAWKNFLIRAGSALVALGLMIGLYLTLGTDGLKVTVCFAVAVSSWELARLLFRDEPWSASRFVFYALSLTVFAGTVLSLSAGTLAYAIALILFIIISLLAKQKVSPLEQIQALHCKAALGLFYTGMLPAFAYKILDQQQGLSWFAFLLATVFAGDTLAYIFGVLMGKHKIMPNVSPKKTWEGSLGGILGSVIAGYVCHQLLLSQFPPLMLILLAALAGFFGQFGDFFESLLKRVADVKDSGKIMPGHGGVLDRIDGVLFAGPVVLTGVLILAHLLS